MAGLCLCWGGKRFEVYSEWMKRSVLAFAEGSMESISDTPVVCTLPCQLALR